MKTFGIVLSCFLSLAFSEPQGAGPAGFISEAELLAKEMEHFNRALAKEKDDLSTLYYEAQKAPADQAQAFLEKIQLKREALKQLEIDVLQKSSKVLGDKDSYAFWNGGEVSLSDLIIHFGALDAIYLMPPDVASLKITLRGQLPVPAALWSHMLACILEENGIAIHALTPCLKQLVRVKADVRGLSTFVDKISDLELLSPDTRACFVVRFVGAESKKLRFLESAGASHQITVQTFEREVFLLGPAHKLIDFAKLSEFVLVNEASSSIKTIAVHKLSAKEAKALIEGALGQRPSRFAPPGQKELFNLRVFSPSESGHMLVLCGEEDKIEEAIHLLDEIEKGIQDPAEKTVFWYTCKNSSAEDIAATLTKIYPQLLATQKKAAAHINITSMQSSFSNKDQGIKRSTEKSTEDKHSEDFIVDVKTGSIIMVVERRALDELKALLKKLDVPKKMVQIEVLLFEKTTHNNNQFGLKNLAMGSFASQKNSGGLDFMGGSDQKAGGGILDFFLSRFRKGAIPAYDLAYRFMLSNRDIQLNACPSITTINAVPAVIAITNEISVDNGITYIDGKDRAVPKQSFSREHYGITITVTPTINEGACASDPGSITLETNINFESINRNLHNRPDVTKRHIENQVRIQDGKTLIIGGLRQKDASGSAQKIPFLGQLPGIGKFFSYTAMDDMKTEMFIFITPHILEDTKESFEKMQKSELQRRPGDVPAFIQARQRSEELHKLKLFDESLKMVFKPSEAIVQE